MRKALILALVLVVLVSGCTQKKVETPVPEETATLTTAPPPTMKPVSTPKPTETPAPTEIINEPTIPKETEDRSGLEVLKQHLRTLALPCEIERPSDAAATAIVIDHDNLYVAIRRKGVFKSSDRGETWRAVNNGILAYPDSNNPDKLCYNWAAVMAMDPTNPDRILLSPGDVNTGTINDPYTETCGIWETLDGGGSWHQLIHGDMNAGGHGALAIDPNDPQTIYFGTGHYPATYSEADPDKLFNTIGVLHKTTDGGKTWEELPTGLLPRTSEGDVFFALKAFIDTEDSDSILMLTNSHSHDYETMAELDLEEQLGPMRSNDGGYTWTALADRLPVNYQNIFGGDVAKTNFDHIHVMASRVGNDVPFELSTKSFYSTDGGETFSETGVYIGIGRYDPHDETGNHMLGFSPLHGDQQIVESRDGGKTWRGIGKPREVDGYTLALYDFAWDPAQPDTVYAVGDSAHVWRSEDGGKRWTTLLDLVTLPE